MVNPCILKKYFLAGNKSENFITLKIIKIMAYYPTPEEEYELMYGEELEMMNELDGKALK